MKKDIVIPKVEDVAITISPEENELGELEWSVYLVNMKDVPITGVLITSRGYVHNYATGKDVKSSTLRHFFEHVPAKSFQKVELIQEELFGLNNEYWLTFYIDKLIHEKKYVFMAESIKEDNFTLVPFLNKKGVMIQ